MKNIINGKRINQIITFLNSLKIKSKRFSEIIKKQNASVIKDFNEALTHSSDDKIINYEKLEFFGDAVLRLAASNFIEKKYPQMSVRERSELRSQIVSDEWLIKLGEEIEIDKLIIKEAYCGKQITMKRFRARAKGRAAPVIKPYSNLTIILSEKNKEMEKHGTKS